MPDNAPDLFRAQRSQIINLRHPLCRLAGQLDWSVFEAEFGPLYAEGPGRPGLPTRLMVGLHCLKYTFNESDESVVERWLENPYWSIISRAVTATASTSCWLAAGYHLAKLLAWISCALKNLWLRRWLPNSSHITTRTHQPITYDGRRRLTQVSDASGANGYQVNGLGQRPRKSGTGGVSRFVHDEAGHLLGEYKSTGAPLREVIYLGNTPIGLMQGSNLFRIYADHLDTPRVITSAANVNRILWRWGADPFGATPAEEDPDANGVAFTFNLRFPGQHFDNETGNHYNYFRDYDPTIGRYIESDPAGLAGWINSYGYALQIH